MYSHFVKKRKINITKSIFFDLTAVTRINMDYYVCVRTLHNILQTYLVIMLHNIFSADKYFLSHIIFGKLCTQKKKKKRKAL